MKKILKITGITLGVIILLLIILPFAFKGTIVKKIKEETNKSLNAKIDFNDFGLSLFRSFPNFSLSLDGLSVVGVDEFKEDTLASVPKLYITIDLMSVFKGSEYKIKKIQADDARILLKGLKSGKVNWDITKKDTSKVPTTPAEPSTFKMAFQKIQINNAHIVYDDASLGFYMMLDGLNHTSKGDMTADITTLKTKTTIKQLDVVYGGVKYLSKSDAEIKLDLGMDMKNMKFTFEENNSRLNQLFFQFEGFFTMLKEGGYDMDIKMKTDKTDFKNILSMVPALYAKDFDKIEAKGKLVFDGFFKGIYKDLNTLPAFALNFQVINGMFKYPSMPKEVNNTNVVCKINNKGGSADNTTIDISNFHIELAGNTIDMRMFLSTPISDPAINMNIKGALDMATVKQVYPLEEGQDLTGSFKADVTMKGKMSSIKKEKYNEFVAQGYLDLQNMKYKSKDFAQGIDIKAARFNFSPQFLELAQFDMLMGKNDFSAKGKIENYIAYWLKGETIKGRLETKSKYFNMNDLMAMAPKDSAAAKKTDKTAPAPTMSVLKIPANIDFYMSADFAKLIYDKMEMENVNGVIEVKDEKLAMKNLSMNMLNGKMTVTGAYSSKNPEKPEADFMLDINNFDIQKAMKTFATMGKMVPIAEKTSGSFSTKFKVNTLLDKTMSPVTNSMKGGGNLSTSKIVIENSESLNKVADALKYNKLKKLNLDKLNIAFLIADGKVITSPFDIKIDNTKAKVSGSTGFDESIDYLMKMEVPRKEIGGAANNVMEGLAAKAKDKGVGVKLADIMKFDVRIGGTFKNPVIKTGLNDVKDNAVNDIKDKAKEEFDKKKEELTNKAKDEANKAIADAQKKADQLVAEAQKQGNTIRAEAKKAGDQLVAEADAQGQKLVDGASNPITKIAAKKTAEKLHNEAVNKSNKLNAEADQKANGLVSNAKTQGDQLIKSAQDKTK
ncbi:MAG: hypothetical protein NTZ33_05290 [Bacteroidetes bacterium]|nr:hypothetical protein [Bacteroidota bacterium]